MSSPLPLLGLEDQNGTTDLGVYVTLDWDQYAEKRIDRLKVEIEGDPFVNRAWIRLSSFKGHHAVLEIAPSWGHHKESVRRIQWAMRRKYRDDPNRMAWDDSRDHPEGVLFDWKRGHWSGPWERFK